MIAIDTNVDFADCLILSDAQYMQLMLHTFDRKLSRLHGAKEVENEDADMKKITL